MIKGMAEDDRTFQLLPAYPAHPAFLLRSTVVLLRGATLYAAT